MNKDHYLQIWRLLDREAAAEGRAEQIKIQLLQLQQIVELMCNELASNQEQAAPWEEYPGMSIAGLVPLILDEVKPALPPRRLDDAKDYFLVFSIFSPLPMGFTINALIPVLWSTAGALPCILLFVVIWAAMLFVGEQLIHAALSLRDRSIEQTIESLERADLSGLANIVVNAAMGHPLVEGVANRPPGGARLFEGALELAAPGVGAPAISAEMEIGDSSPPGGARLPGPSGDAVELSSSRNAMYGSSPGRRDEDASPGPEGDLRPR